LKTLKNAKVKFGTGTETGGISYRLIDTGHTRSELGGGTKLKNVLRKGGRANASSKVEQADREETKNQTSGGTNLKKRKSLLQGLSVTHLAKKREKGGGGRDF